MQSVKKEFERLKKEFMNIIEDMPKEALLNILKAMLYHYNRAVFIEGDHDKASKLSDDINEIIEYLDEDETDRIILEAGEMTLEERGISRYSLLDHLLRDHAYLLPLTVEILEDITKSLEAGDNKEALETAKTGMICLKMEWETVDRMALERFGSGWDRLKDSVVKEMDDFFKKLESDNDDETLKTLEV